MLANAGDHILQRPPLRRVVKHIAYRDERNSGFCRDPGKARQPPGIVAAIEYADAEPHRARRHRVQAGEDSCQIARRKRVVCGLFVVWGLVWRSLIPNRHCRA
jgi:hypothetical protein